MIIAACLEAGVTRLYSKDFGEKLRGAGVFSHRGLSAVRVPVFMWCDSLHTLEEQARHDISLALGNLRVL